MNNEGSSAGAAAIPVCAAPNPNPGTPKIAVPQNSCDCHAHIFGPVAQYPFTPKRSYTPPPASLQAYQRMLSALGLDRAVIVQPSVYGTDNRCTHDAVVAARGQWRGIAVVDANTNMQELRRLHDAGFRGVRINLLFKGGGLAMDTLEEVARLIAPLAWHVQLLIDGRDLPELAPRLQRLPVPFVIDHMGHMPVELGLAHPAFQTLLALVREGNCWVKLSGAYRISAKPYPYEDVVPIAQALVEAAPEHLVWGSDWPHPSFQGAMPVDATLLDLLAVWVPVSRTRALILTTNPAQLYDFG
jgi:predicted TIM-barrel fold metal-dependent hydrolase